MALHVSGENAKLSYSTEISCAIQKLSKEHRHITYALSFFEDNYIFKKRQEI